MELTPKQKQFNAAMELYTTKSRYKVLGLAVSIVTITLQCYLLCRIWPHSIGIARQVGSLFAAYLLTDFINGLVHMYMDNNDRYTSLDGPLIANFHMHHKVPHYTKRPLIVVYFMESGSKVWLVPYLLLVLGLGYIEIPSILYFTLVYTGILSSVAEVSHYLCHSSTARLPGLLAACGLLLSKRHHARHHLEDNVNFAFLNGCSDPLLNLIAARWSVGYKAGTDLHYEAFASGQVDER